MKISIEMPDDAFERVVNGFAKTYGVEYDTKLRENNQTDSQETRIDFWKFKMMDYAKEISIANTKAEKKADFAARIDPLVDAAAKQAFAETVVTVEPS